MLLLCSKYLYEADATRAGQFGFKMNWLWIFEVLSDRCKTNQTHKFNHMFHTKMRLLDDKQYYHEFITTEMNQKEVGMK
jgi:hypothetical protein